MLPLQLISKSFAMEIWKEQDATAQTQIELALSDAEMVHIMGLAPAAQMCTLLHTVKEARGKMGIMAARRRLYRTIADEDISIVEYIDVPSTPRRVKFHGQYILR